MILKTKHLIGTSYTLLDTSILLNDNYGYAAAATCTYQVYEYVPNYLYGLTMGQS